MTIILLNSTTEYRQQWRSFVLNHPHGQVFHLPAMVEVYENTPLYKPFACAVVGDDDEFLGVLVACVQREFKGFLGSFTARSILMGCPLVKDNDATIGMQLLTFYEQHIAKEVIYSQVRNLYDMSWLRTSFEQLNYKYEEHLDIIVNLRKERDELWNDMQSNGRGRIRKAQKNGLLVKPIFNEIDKDIAYTILVEVYHRARLPLASKILFDNAIKCLTESNNLIYFGAYYNDVLVGIRIVLVCGKKAYDWYGGSFSAYYQLNPNDIIPWQIFCYLKEQGIDEYDWGGAGNPNKPYGVRDYKKKFGGELVHYGRYEKVNKPLLMLIGRIGFYILKTLKR